MRALAAVRIASTTLAWLAIAPASSRSADVAPAQPERVLTWGDQGDGTFRNPILKADYSDPDVIRVGDDFYLVASDFHFVGIQVLHSKDLVNWRIASQVFDRLTMSPKYDEMKGYAEGTWAPSLRYHAGQFYLYVCSPHEGLFLFRAKDPRGPWSMTTVKAVDRWEDPAPFWDDDGKAYLVHSLLGAGPLILHRMSPDGTRLLDDGVEVYRGPVAEGPKLFKRAGYYYISLPEGGVGTGGQTMLRSKSLRGPYERKVVLPNGSPHQGGIVELPSGESWFVGFKSSGHLGRVVHLMPVKWGQDGWPVFGDAGRAAQSFKKPAVASPQPIARPQTSDEFEGRSLGPQWQWNHNPVPAAVTLAARPGFLRLVGLPADELSRARNTLTQKLWGDSGVVDTRVDASGLAEGQRAGFAFMSGSAFSWVGVVREGGVLRVAPSDGPGPALAGQELWLRGRYDGDVGRLAYSLDGTSYVEAGAFVPLRFGHWKGARVAVFSYGGGGTADFDYVRYRCDDTVPAATARQEIERRANELLGRMTLTEKIGQLVQVNAQGGTVPDALRERVRQGRIGSMLNEIVPAASQELQRLAVEESRLGIPLLMGRDVIHGYRTIFPIPLGQAAAWDPDLVTAAAAVAAEEAAGAGFQWTFAPMMDIARDPRWGRIAEGFGEDPHLASVLAAAMVRGFQGERLGAPNRIAACAKHYAGYGAAEGGRDYDTANIPEGLLRDVYLPPFRAAVEAGVATVMTSFNEINGVPSTGSEFLLRQVLRGEWGFEGFVVSDWNSMSEMIPHGFASDLDDVALKSLTAGVDMEMQSTAYSDHLEALVKAGKLPERLVDEAARNVLRVKLELGLFDTRRPFSAKPPGPPSPQTLALAKTAAVRSLVLLKNEGRLLPLARGTASVAVIGPLADDPYEVLGTWNRDGRVEDTVTPLAAIRSLLGSAERVRFAPGLSQARSRDTSGFAAAVEAARQSDVALAFVGEEAILSGEAHSRAHLDLPGAQRELVEAVAATGKPLVLVVLAGRPLTLPDVFAKAGAVLYAWHPGTMTGPALADLLFGVESPSGKLPVTFPKTEGQIPVYYAHKNTGRPPTERKLTLIDDIPPRARQSSLGDASRYLDIGYEPLYPFGYGLAYTDFRYANLRLSAARVTKADTLRVLVDVTNTGGRDGQEIVQLYVRDVVASLTRPVKELKAFQRVRIPAGQTKVVELELPASSLGFHDATMHYVVEPGAFRLWVGGDSQSGLETGFEVTE